LLFILSEFYCTLTLDLPHEPVIDPDGYTFEQVSVYEVELLRVLIEEYAFSLIWYISTKQAAIVHWVQINSDSPVTRKPLTVEQLRDNDAVLSILLLESEKPADCIHPCIQRWKDELMSPPPSIVPPPETNSSPVTLVRRTGAQAPVLVYPTSHDEMEERRRIAHRASMIYLVLLIVIISFAVIYFPLYLVVFALAVASCMYARRKLHARNPRATIRGP
jgi:hypothetical protein